MTFICFFLCSGCEKRVNDFTIRHREKSKKSSIYSLSSSQQFYNHVFKFSNPSLFHWTSLHLSCELLSSGYFLMWKGRYSTFVFSFLFNGSSLNVMQSLPVGRSHSWQLNVHHFLYPQQMVIVMKQLEISHHTAKEQDCALWSVQVLHLSVCTDEIECECEMTILLCVMEIIQFCKKHMHCNGRIVSKYSFLKTMALTICAWCFCEKIGDMVE